MLKYAIVRFDPIFVDIRNFYIGVAKTLEKSEDPILLNIPAAIKTIRNKSLMLDNLDTLNTLGLSEENLKYLKDQIEKIIDAKIEQSCVLHVNDPATQMINYFESNNEKISIIVSHNIEKRFMALCKEFKSVDIIEFASNQTLEKSDILNLLEVNDVFPHEVLYMSSINNELEVAQEVGCFTVGIKHNAFAKIKYADLMFNTVEDFNWDEVKFNFISKMEK